MATRRVIGIDAGGTKLLGGVVDDDLTVHARVHRLWDRTDKASVLQKMVEEVTAALEVAPDAEAVGFGIPSLVDRTRAVSQWSNHLDLDDVAFRDLMSERLGLPVYVENDANAALLAKREYGAARGASDALLLTRGTGIGGALSLGGRLHRGATGAAGELGHVVVDMNGPPCPGKCPNRGCLEALASGTALGGEGGRRGGVGGPGGPEVTGEGVAELAHAGDRAALAAVETIGRALGAGISGLVNAFDPEV